MKILLQHSRTLLFWRCVGCWTANREEAHDFEQSQRVLDFVAEHGLTGMQIAISFIDSQFDEVFRIVPGEKPTVLVP